MRVVSFLRNRAPGYKEIAGDIGTATNPHESYEGAHPSRRPCRALSRAVCTFTMAQVMLEVRKTVESANRSRDPQGGPRGDPTLGVGAPRVVSTACLGEQFTYLLCSRAHRLNLCIVEAPFMTKIATYLPSNNVCTFSQKSSLSRGHWQTHDPVKSGIRYVV